MSGRDSADSHDVLHRFGFDEDGDGVKLSQLESLDGVPRHVQDTVFALKTTEEERNVYQRWSFQKLQKESVLIFTRLKPAQKRQARNLVPTLHHLLCY